MNAAPERQTRAELVPWPLAALAATLDRDPLLPAPGTPLPLTAHWLYAQETPRASQLGPDGHAKRGDFLPVIDLPRRMWAGGTLHFHAPLRVGAVMDKRSRIKDVAHKRGRSGPLAFVTVEHVCALDGVTCVVEEQTIVYRADPPPGAPRTEPTPAPEAEEPGEVWRFDAVALMRFSALTFNGHRIHYDLRHAREVEGYADLVVHGPLLALLLLDRLSRTVGQARIARFDYRARKPVLCAEPVTLCQRIAARHAEAWVRDAAGHLCLHGAARLRDDD